MASDSWTKRRGEHEYWVQVTDQSVVFGDQVMISGHHPGGESTQGLREFLEDEWSQKTVREHHGPSVLEAVLAAVRRHLEARRL